MKTTCYGVNFAKVVRKKPAVIGKYKPFTNVLQRINLDNNIELQYERIIATIIRRYYSSMIIRTPFFKSSIMGTSSSIRHRFDVEIPSEKFVEITSILKGESTWELWHRFDVEISTRIWLSKSTKYRWVLWGIFLWLFDVESTNLCTRCFHSIIS